MKVFHGLKRGLVIGLVVGLALVVVALYQPFWENPAVFDDHNIVSNLALYDHAVTSRPWIPRELPYFSIGFVHVLSDGNLVWNRLVSTTLHGLIALALFRFVRRAISSRANDKAKDFVSLCVALWFALNPVAVYGTAYLVQRSIVMATLFGLVSATLYLRAQQENRNADIVSAALLGALAMMSKEHAVLLPLAVVVLTPLVADWQRAGVLRAANFIALSLPGMACAILYRGVSVVGTSYETYVGDVLTQITLPGFAGTQLGIWILSIATQCLLFWKYLLFWCLPNPGWMAADLRIDFDALWGGMGGPLGATLSLLVFALAAWTWWRRGAGTVIGQLATALLYVLVLFGVEFSVVRVQEPFVLYRSFLWMPGYALILAFLLLQADRWVAAKGLVWRRLLWGGCILACLGFFPLAQDRLLSFSSEEALWQDAEAKLPRPDVAGADRIYYNLAGEAFKRKDYAMALDYSNRVIHQNPGAFYGYLARGTSLLALRDTDGALAAFAAADQPHLAPQFRAYIEFKRCGVYSARGEKDETIACLRRSARLGHEMAKFQLRMAGLAEE